MILSKKFECTTEDLDSVVVSLAKEIEIHKVIQFFFFTQWKNLKEYADLVVNTRENGGNFIKITAKLCVCIIL